MAVLNPPAWVPALEPGTEIIGVGRIRRRFFRAAGARLADELEADLSEGERSAPGAGRTAQGERRARDPRLLTTTACRRRE
jgi:hypothetical protein